ncbi:MAG: serine hydrolase [Endomicrobiales bacterium]|nr:serine hydrolase [Endomicrobiales bacterium]
MKRILSGINDILKYKIIRFKIVRGVRRIRQSQSRARYKGFRFLNIDYEQDRSKKRARMNQVINSFKSTADFKKFRRFYYKSLSGKLLKLFYSVRNILLSLFLAAFNDLRHLLRRIVLGFRYKHAFLLTGMVLAVSLGFYYLAFTERCKDYHKLIYDLERQSSEFSGEVGIFVKDLWTGKTIKINSNMLFPSASLVKVPIMAALFQAQEDGILDFSDEIALKRRHKVWAKHGLYRKRVGTKYTIEQLIKHMIVTSDNTATNMLVEVLGFDYLNEKFAEFGIYDTNLCRGVMELKLRRRGIENYTTAEDMALLLEKIYKKELVSSKASKRMLEILKSQRVNDRIPYLLPDDLDVAHKTGSLKDTISDVGIVFTSKGDFIICVLTLNEKNWRKAKKFIRDIAAHTYNYCYGKS